MDGTKNRFVAYWTGYANHGIALRDTPEYVEYVNLFLVNLDPDSGLQHKYIVSDGISWDQIMDDARFLQSRGQKVLASVMSTPDPEYSWNSIDDPPEFARKAVDLAIGEWGLDGIDIDPEIGDGVKPNENFIKVVGALRDELGGEKLLTFVSYVIDYDADLLRRNVDVLDYVSLMGYFWDTSSYKNEFQRYAKVVPKDKLLIGVSPAQPQTPLQEVKELCSWQSGQGGGGMMLFATPYDLQYYSGRPDWTYCQSIESCLKV